MKTTLNAIRAKRPCHSGWAKLLRTLNKTPSNDEPISIIQILESNGLDDAIWCLRAVTGHDREIRLFAVWCARQVEHMMTDARSKNALNVAERHANGQATYVELDVAKDAAWAVACHTPNNGANCAAWCATRNDAWDAAHLARRATNDAVRDAQEAELRRICAP